MTASELTQTVSEMLADTVNALSDGEDVSASTANTAALVGALYNTTVGGSGTPHKTMTIAAILAGIRNALSDDTDVSNLNVRSSVLLAQIANELSGTSDYSSLTHSPSQLLAAICTAAEAGGGGDLPDFTGWSAGSEAGVYTDGETGGRFPTGCALNLSFDEGEDPTLEITEATHTEDSVEAITISLTAVGNGCLFELYFPNGQEGQPASEGQTWRLDACLRVDAGDVTPTNIAISLGSDGGEIDLNEDAIQDGGNLASSLRTIQGAALAETTEVHGYISFVIPAGSVTITLALKLEQVS